MTEKNINNCIEKCPANVKNFLGHFQKLLTHKNIKNLYDYLNNRPINPNKIKIIFDKASII